jgi:hypothetical protein
MDIIVESMIVDIYNIIDIYVSMVEGHGYFCFCNVTVSEHASYKIKNKSANKGAQLLSIKMPTD